MKKECPKRKSDNCIVRLVYWISNKIWRFLTFTLYIRAFIELSQFWMIVSISEINDSNFSSIETLISFGVACALLSGMIIMTSLNAVISLGVCFTSDKSSALFKEFFNGIKNTKMAKMYNVAIISRRVALTSCMILLSDIDKVYLLTAVVLYQIAHTFYIIQARPYASVKDNINEILIDLTLVVLLALLLYFPNEDAWDEVASSAYFYLLCFPGMFVFLSSISKLVN